MSKLSVWKVVCVGAAGMALSLLAANVLRADSFSDQAAKLDIVGVHLGMTPAQAKSALTQHRKGMRWLKGKDDISSGVFVMWSGSNADFEEIFVSFSPSGDPKVVAVRRILKFAQSQAPTFENLANSLTEKFGQPSSKPPPTFLWAWDKAGQISTAIPRDICHVGDDYNHLDNHTTSIPGLQHENDGGCAIAVEAQINSGNSGIVNQLFVTLIDLHDALQAGIAADNHVKQANEAKKQEELKKASANRAPAL